jgi:hypothetical protein
LTVSAGLRWELLPPFQDKNGIAADFDPQTNSVIIPEAVVQRFRVLDNRGHGSVGKG